MGMNELCIMQSGEIIVDGVCVDNCQPLIRRAWMCIIEREKVPYGCNRFRRLQKLVERHGQRIQQRYNMWLDQCKESAND